jgi:hypothetical protein
MKTKSTDIESKYDFTIWSLNISASLQTKQSADAHLAEAQYWHGQPTLNLQMSLKYIWYKEPTRCNFGSIVY